MSTNPKDLVGVTKPQLHLVPPALVLHAATAMADGAKKYGPYNWREHPVKMTVYLDGIMRHVYALLDGENRARDSQHLHLGHIGANVAIILDALESGNLIDDRPKAGPAADIIEKLTAMRPVAPPLNFPPETSREDWSDITITLNGAQLDAVESCTWDADDESLDELEDTDREDNRERRTSKVDSGYVASPELDAFVAARRRAKKIARVIRVGDRLRSPWGEVWEANHADTEHDYPNEAPGWTHEDGSPIHFDDAPPTSRCGAV